MPNCFPKRLCESSSLGQLLRKFSFFSLTVGHIGKLGNKAVMVSSLEPFNTVLLGSVELTAQASPANTLQGLLLRGEAGQGFSCLPALHVDPSLLQLSAPETHPEFPATHGWSGFVPPCESPSVCCLCPRSPVRLLNACRVL